MIEDKDMINLGFKKKKHLRKTRTEESNMSWQLGTALELRLIRFNNDDYYSPTLVLENSSFAFKEIDEVYSLMKALFLLD